MLKDWRDTIMVQLGMKAPGVHPSEEGVVAAHRRAAASSQQETIDRRVTYLKKQLTEAKIRAKIRRIIKEAE